jgi:hypothetical protein
MWKKSFNFVAVILATVTVIGLSSCKDNKVYYSCDPTIDAVIRQNLPKYENKTREEWKNLPDSLKDAAYVAMKPEVKKEFWYGKLNEIKEAKFFNDSEKEHISKLYDYVLSIDYLYTDKYKDDSKEMQKIFEYYKEWAFYGVDSLNWDVVDIFLIAEDKEELTEDYIYYVKQNAATNNSTLQHEGGASNGNKPKCNCQYDIGCAGYGYCDIKIECEVKRDCGIFGVFNCYKRCREPYTLPNGQSVNVIEYSNQRELLQYMFTIKD